MSLPFFLHLKTNGYLSREIDTNFKTFQIRCGEALLAAHWSPALFFTIEIPENSHKGRMKWRTLLYNEEAVTIFGVATLEYHHDWLIHEILRMRVEMTGRQGHRRILHSGCRQP